MSGGRLKSLGTPVALAFVLKFCFLGLARCPARPYAKAHAGTAASERSSADQGLRLNESPLRYSAGRTTPRESKKSLAVLVAFAVSVMYLTVPKKRVVWNVVLSVVSQGPSFFATLWGRLSLRLPPGGLEPLSILAVAGVLEAPPWVNCRALAGCKWPPGLEAAMLACEKLTGRGLS